MVWTVLPDGDHVLPTVAESYATGTMLPMIPGPRTLPPSSNG